MNVATKLAAGFALLMSMLAALLIYHVRTTRNAVSTGYELAEIVSGRYVYAIDQLFLVAQLEDNAAKYWITRDWRYFERFNELFAAYEAQLRQLEAVDLSTQERAELSALAVEWAGFGRFASRIEELGASGQASRDSLITHLDRLRRQTQMVNEASQAAMLARLELAERAAHEAERLSWIAGACALILSALISVLIVRSISEPLNRLKEGTREVARGRFDHRLETSRGDEFAQVARDFNIMTERLGELDAMKRDFISKVSHDLKTPLASMQETIDVVLDEVPGPLTDTQRRLLGLNHQSGQRLSAMLAKLLDMSSLEAGVLAPQRHMLELGSIVTRALEQNEPASIDRDLSIRVDMIGQPILLEADAERLLQVLDNLLENALKFSPPDGVIDLKLRALTARPHDIPGDRWRPVESRDPSLMVAHLTVADAGPGVPDEHKERIFERFYQTDAGRAVRGRGVGLGLTICQEIMSAHGGSIWVEDNPGGGSIFHLLLPGAFRVPPHARLEGATVVPELARS